MALRRAQLGSGSDLAALRETPPPYAWAEIVPALPGIPHAVAGGLAVARYMPARMTLDTDILIRRDDQARAEGVLRDTEATYLGPLTIGGSVWRLSSGRPLDLLAPDAPWVDEALDRAASGPGGLPFVPLPFLVLMKLESGRTQDLADISRMLGFADKDDVDEVRAIVARHRPQDAEDLESLAILGQREHETPTP